MKETCFERREITICTKITVVRVSPTAQFGSVAGNLYSKLSLIGNYKGNFKRGEAVTIFVSD